MSQLPPTPGRDAASAAKPVQGGGALSSVAMAGASAPEQNGAQPVKGAGRWLRFIAWALLAGFCGAGSVAWFYLLRGELLLRRLEVLQIGWLALAAGVLGLWLLLATTPPGALRFSPRLSKRVLLVVSLAVLGSAVAWLRPVLSVEVTRYRYDGRAWLLWLSPYRVAPEEAARIAATTNDPEFRPDTLDLAAPHPDRTSLNLPVSQVSFAVTRALEYLAVVSQTQDVVPPYAPPSAREPEALAATGAADWRALLLDLPWWRQMFFWRCVLAGALLLAMGEMIAWLRYRELSPWWAIVFTWHPLVLMETLGGSHQDMIGVLFLIAGLRRADAGNMRRAAICLAASVAVKPLALLVLPFVIRRAWRTHSSERHPARRLEAPPSSRSAARRLVVWFVLTLALLLAPLYSAEALKGLGSALHGYVLDPPENAAVARLLEAMFAGSDASPARLLRVRIAGWVICSAVTLLTGMVAWQRRISPAGALYAMLLAALLFAPLAQPWLLMWPLAMVPMLRGRAGPAALVWAGSAALSYAPATLYGGELPARMMFWQFAPVYVLGISEALAAGRRAKRAHRPDTAERAKPTAP